MVVVKSIFIVHRWGGSPEDDWYPWLKAQLEKDGHMAFDPQMPNPNNPKISEWVEALRAIVGNVDQDCFFVGHSIGCQTILRYIETLPEVTKIGGVILVAPWLKLLRSNIGEEEKNIAKPWEETTINWGKIKDKTKNILAIFSNNDVYVDLKEADLLKEKLGAKIIIEDSKGHFTSDDGVKELPVLLAELNKMLS